MPDFSTPLLHLPSPGAISTYGMCSLFGDQACMQGAAGAGAVWPSANRAVYVPVMVESYVTVHQMAFEVTVQSGNYDIGIYDANGVQLVALGSTAVPAVGIATANITDTPLTPGTYFLALAINNGTAAVWRHNIGSAGSHTVAGVQDQDTAFALPATATFSTPGTIYVPGIVAATRSVI